MASEKSYWYQKAMEHYIEHNYASSLFAIQQHLSEQDSDRSAQLLLAIIYTDLANYEQAAEQMAELSLNAKDSAAFKESFHTTNAKIAEGQLDSEKAIRQFDKLIKTSSKSAYGYILKGAYQFKLGRYDKAILTFKEATKKTGDVDEAWYNMALIYRAKMNFAEAEKCCKRALMSDSENEDVLDCLADLKSVQAMKEEH